MQNEKSPNIPIIKITKLLLSFLKDEKPKFVFWFIVTTLIFFHSMIPPLFVSGIIDYCINYDQEKSPSKLYILIIGLGVIWAIASIIRLEGKRALGNLSIEAASVCRVQGFNSLIRQDVLEQKSELSGSKIQKIQAASQSIQKIENLLTGELLPVIASVIGPLLAFSFSSIELLAIVISYLIIFSYTQKKFIISHKKAQFELNLAKEQSAGRLVEGASNIMTIQSLGVEREFTHNISIGENKLKEAELKLKHVGIRMWQVFQIINGLALSIFMFYLTRLVFKGSLSVGSVYLYFSYFYQLITSFGQISALLANLWESRIAIERVWPLFIDNLADYSSKRIFPKNWRTLTLKNISFEYSNSEGNKGIFDINLKANKGQKIAIVGGSGCGKSTTAKILAGIYQPQAGLYQIDNLDMRDISRSSFRDNVSIVLQDTELFELSLRDNLTLNRSISAEALEKAIYTAELEYVIKQLPDGMNSIIIEKGLNLSGGEKQRISIARALCQNPEILILDEATSALDLQTEAKIMEKLCNFYPNLTVFMITHRNEILKLMDNVINLMQ